jgi:rRNA maturation endonuclease Nob1
MANIEIGKEEIYLYQCLKCKRIYLLTIDVDDTNCCGNQLEEIGKVIVDVY